MITRRGLLKRLGALALGGAIAALRGVLPAPDSAVPEPVPRLKAIDRWPSYGKSPIQAIPPARLRAVWSHELICDDELWALSNNPEWRKAIAAAVADYMDRIILYSCL